MKTLILSENFFEDSELFYPYFRLIEEGYKVAKERDLLQIGKQLKKVYEKVESL